MRFDWDSKRVVLEGVYTLRDFFEVENVTYQAIPLDENSKKGLGINSSVFRAVREDDGHSTLIVKVCNFADEHNGEKSIARRARFDREIKAMELSMDKGKHNLVVRLEGKGEIKVRTDRGERTHRCFLMEPARQNLGEYLAQEVEISFQQRLLLCADMIRSVRALHDIDVYHRDIKPENILQCEEGWKIGDLGLVAFRDDDSEADSREKIGPPRWMSPEAFNKAYCIQRQNNTYIDRQLDERSDVYQLGKVCWHILQGDIPNGCLKSKDLVEGGENLFGCLLKPMLRYQRRERPLLSELEERLTPLIRQHSI
jgi:serine/threonine protein kinase